MVSAERHSEYMTLESFFAYNTTSNLYHPAGSLWNRMAAEDCAYNIY